MSADTANVTGIGGNYTVQHLGGSNITADIGFQASVIHGGSGTMGQAVGGQYLLANSGSGTLSNSIGVSVSGTNTGTGTITNSYGVQIGTMAGTNRWGLYQVDTSANNYFGGKLGIGVTTPQAGLDIATTGTLASAVIVPRDTTGNRPATAVNGMIRYNSNSNKFEAYENGAWTNVIGGIAAGATGLFADGSTSAPSIAF